MNCKIGEPVAGCGIILATNSAAARSDITQQTISHYNNITTKSCWISVLIKRHPRKIKLERLKK